MYRLGCDVGGTFTDFALFDEATGEIRVEKCLTTPDDPSEAFFAGIERLNSEEPNFLGKTKHVIHGTTLAINAILERKGAKTALVTTKGFRDIVEMRRTTRGDLFDIQGDLPSTLVPRHLRRELDERTLSDGTILKAIDHHEVSSLARQLITENVESVAVCLLHSYANPTHERLAREILSEKSEFSVSLSCEVLPRIQEFERCSATIVNAYVKPVIEEYLPRIRQGLEELGFTGNLLVMLSEGSIGSLETAVALPIRMIESGPVGGVLASQQYARLLDMSNVVAFDMGGTTAKSCLIERGNVPITSEHEIARVYRFRRGSGIPLNTPSVEVLEVGAGGGSIAHLDALGLLAVGPQSAGANPGPACYAMGGEDPTLTDADLILGYLDPDYFLGGRMKLDKEAAMIAIEREIAKPCRLTISEAAWRIHDLANENMAMALRLQAAEKGVDLSRFTLVAYGGAGPGHAYALAEKLGICRILVPMGSGVTSAIGLLVAPSAFTAVHTHKVGLAQADLDQISRLYDELEEYATQVVRRAEPTANLLAVRTLDACYAGQGYEINIPIPSQKLDVRHKEHIREAFNAHYKGRYGYAYPDVPVELVHLGVTVSAPHPPLSLRSAASSSASSISRALKGRRRAYSVYSNSFVDHAVYDRYLLFPGATFNGPAIIEERECTTVIGCTGRVTIDEFGNLLILLEGD